MAFWMRNNYSKDGQDYSETLREHAVRRDGKALAVVSVHGDDPKGYRLLLYSSKGPPPSW